MAMALEFCTEGYAQGHGPPPVVEITKPVFKIGRAAKRVDLSFDSPTRPLMMSRLHATISAEGNGQWKVTDCKSLNGIFVNGIKVEEAYLRDGDEIVFGEGGTCSLGAALMVANPEFKCVCRLPQSTSQGANEGERPHAKATQWRRRKRAGATKKMKRRMKQSDQRKRGALESRLAVAEAQLAEHRRQMAEAELLRQELDHKERLLDEEKHIVEEARHLKASLEARETELEREKDQLQRALAQRESELEAQLKADQERRAGDEERRRAALEATKLMLADERQRLEREHSARELDLAREREALERQRAELESQIAQKRREIESEAIQRSELEEEFLCVICHGLMIAAMTLECAHSFCSTCLDGWMAQKQPVTRTPVRALNLDNIIGKIVQKMPPADKAEWEERAQKLRKVEEEIKQLQNLIESAKTRGLRFLVIWDSWTDDEKKIFADGVVRYVGKPRVLYCSTVGLTSQFVESCSRPHLIVAARNLDLLNSPDIDRLRANLLDFIHQNDE
ncbi:FHA domain containing protein [Acanthamoeba castellanii str. Neff]|uniref:E3 ubiquitin-protein ligase CHFR n=1 Tax=Acanthamoeba castellanii (strain ATCC 30010 / Neff) TaxID=1257118 RepID=L8HEB4_ACACF|nr:FHA domain containing protein [Acanthamoeba castellanii str. Neff]ELR23567.1 FHA domain containing protein [Acanthamoeba castellanii str. Neff]